MPGLIPDTKGINAKYNNFFSNQRENLTGFGNQFSRFSSENINQIDKLAHKGEGAWSKFKSKGSSAISSLSDKLSGLNSTVGMLFGGMALGGIAEMTVGAAAENQQMEGLLASTLKSKEAAADLSKATRDITKGSMMMPNQMMKAAAILKMSTGMGKEDMKDSLKLLKDMGQNLSLQGYAGKELENYLTSALDGLTGNWARLRNKLGIDKEDVIGKGWSGETDDVQGYLKAMNELLKEKADLDGSMDNTMGRMTQVKNNIQLLAMDIGSVLLPPLDALLKWILSLDSGTQKWVVGIGLLVASIVAAAPFIVLIGNSFVSLYNGGKKAISAIKDIPDNLSKMKNGLSTAKSSILQFKDTAVSAFNTAKEKVVSGIAAMKTEATTGFPGIKSAASNAFTSIKTGARTAFTTLKTQAAQAFAFLMANPIILVVAGIVLLVIAIEKLGERMGWWKNWGDMFGKFKDAVVNACKKIWEMLLPLREAFGRLGQALQPVINGIKAVFGFIVGILRAYVGFWIWFYTTLFNLIVGGLTAVWNFIVGIVGGAYNWLVSTLDGIVVTIGQGIEGLAGFITGIVTTIIQTIINILTSIVNFITFIVTNIISIVTGVFNFVVGSVQSFVEILIRGFTRMWEFIVGILTDVIGFVTGIFNGIVSVISGVIGTAASAARNLAQGIYNGTIGKIIGIADRVKEEFMKIADKIKGAASSAIDAAKNFGSDIVKSVFSAFDFGSPGVIQRTVKWEFDTIGGHIDDAKDKAVFSARKFGMDVVHGVNLDNFKGMMPSAPNTTNNNSSKVIYFNEGAFQIDAKDRTMQDVAREVIGLFESIGDGSEVI